MIDTAALMEASLAVAIDVYRGASLIEWLELDLLGRLLVAALLGGVIGVEREMRGKSAGFRTNMLIAIGAALLTEISVAISTVGSAVADPARLAAQIVSGIGFLGAGVIWQSKGHVVGITTAATIWVVAAIGIAVGAGMYVPAIGTTVFVLIALVALGKIEPVFRSRPHQHRLHIKMYGGMGDLGWLQERVEEVGLEEVEFVRGEFEPTPGVEKTGEYQMGTVYVTFNVAAGEETLREAMVSLLMLEVMRAVWAE